MSSLPQRSNSIGSFIGLDIRKCPPPSSFHPAGEVVTAELSPRLLFPLPKRISKARKEGLKYEARIQQLLARSFPNLYVLGPWLKFSSKHRSKPSWCQPDTILIDIVRGTITVIEIKTRHTSAAWWQLQRLYIPVLKALFGTHLWKFVPIEIVRWFDPHENFPEEFTILKNLEDISTLQDDKFYLYITSGRK